MQCEAKKWADAFNSEGVPKPVDFLEAYLIQVQSHVTPHTSHTTHLTPHISHLTTHTSHTTHHTPHTPHTTHTTPYTSHVTQLIDRPGQPLAAVEKFTEGE